MKDSSFSFVTKRCSALTDTEMNSASALFSNKTPAAIKTLGFGDLQEGYEWLAFAF